MLFVDPAPFEHLRADHVSLLPIAWRHEVSAEAYFTDARFLRKPTERVHPLPIGKSRFKLRLKSGSFRQESPHFYLVRCPRSGLSNGLFTVEIEYEGEGTQGVDDVAVAGTTHVVTIDGGKVQRPAQAVVTHPEDIPRKLKATTDTLNFIRGGPAKAADLSHDLVRTWIHVAEKGDRKAFALRLGETHDLIQVCYSECEALRHQWREYDDLPDALSSAPNKDGFTELTGRFSNAMLDTRNTLLIEPYAKEWRRWTEAWGRWRNGAEEKLIEIKRQLSR